MLPDKNLNLSDKDAVVDCKSFYKALRRKGVKQCHLADLCDVSTTAVSNWGKENYIPTRHIFIFEKLCKREKIKMPRYLFDPRGKR